eukprot:scpid77110/ scgid30057/ 
MSSVCGAGSNAVGAPYAGAMDVANADIDELLVAATTASAMHPVNGLLNVFPVSSSSPHLGVSLPLESMTQAMTSAGVPFDAASVQLQDVIAGSGHSVSALRGHLSVPSTEAMSTTAMCTSSQCDLSHVLAQNCCTDADLVNSLPNFARQAPMQHSFSTSNGHAVMDMDMRQTDSPSSHSSASSSVHSPPRLEHCVQLKHLERGGSVHQQIEQQESLIHQLSVPQDHNRSVSPSSSNSSTAGQKTNMLLEMLRKQQEQLQQQQTIHEDLVRVLHANNTSASGNVYTEGQQLYTTPREQMASVQQLHALNQQSLLAEYVEGQKELQRSQALLEQRRLQVQALQEQQRLDEQVAQQRAERLHQEQQQYLQQQQQQQ